MHAKILLQSAIRFSEYVPLQYKGLFHYVLITVSRHKFFIRLFHDAVPAIG
jgi:hypothetical protein